MLFPLYWFAIIVPELSAKVKLKEVVPMMREDDWFNCYSDGWTNEIVPEAFSHP